MIDIKINLKRKKTIFLVWAAVETFIFIFTEFIVEILKENTTYENFEKSHSLILLFLRVIIKCVQILGFVVLCKIFYEINEILAEPILNIDAYFKGFENQAARVDEKLDILDNIDGIFGVVKQVEQPTIWEFSDKVFGWNPNWSIELSSTHPNGKKLREIHMKRIEANMVNEIEYIFFENYKIDNTNSECFGFNFFLQALGKVDEEYQKSHRVNLNAIRNGVKKYKIWIVPEKLHTDKQSAYYDELKAYKNFIFLCGHKEFGRTHMVIFINKKGFMVNNYHKYYIEIYNGNQIYDYLSEYFSHITQILLDSDISSKNVTFNHANKKFELT